MADATEETIVEALFGYGIVIPEGATFSYDPDMEIQEMRLKLEGFFRICHGYKRVLSASIQFCRTYK